MSKNMKDYEEGTLSINSFFEHGKQKYRPFIIPNGLADTKDQWGIPVYYSYFSRKEAMERGAEMCNWLGWKKIED